MLRRKAQSKETKLYGASVMGVGVGAVAFHASSGKLRHWGRKLDYWVSVQIQQTCYPSQRVQTQMARKAKQRALSPHLICGHASLGTSPSTRPVFIVQMAPCKCCMAAWQQCCFLKAQIQLGSYTRYHACGCKWASPSAGDISCHCSTAEGGLS